MQTAHPRWMDPDTEYRIERTGRGAGHDQPTGRIICDDCGRAAYHIEQIDHGPNCENVPEDDDDA